MEFKDLGRWNSDANARREDLTRIGEGRAPGLHLSEVIQALRQKQGLPSGGVPGEPEWLAAQDGFLFEHAMEYHRAGVSIGEAMELSFKRYMLACRADVVKQLTTQRAGILMSPDGYDPTTYTLESYKRTKKSMRKAADGASFQEHFWPWIMQEGCYQLALQDEGYRVDRILWIVYWVNGNYSRKPWPEGIGQEVRMYEAKLMPNELASIWSTVSAAALHLRNNTSALSVGVPKEEANEV